MKRKLGALAAALIAVVGIAASAQVATAHDLHDTVSDCGYGAGSCDGYHWRGYWPNSSSYKGIEVRYYMPRVTWPTDGTKATVALAAWYRHAEIDVAAKLDGNRYVISSNQPWGTEEAVVNAGAYYWLRVVQCNGAVDVCGYFKRPSDTVWQKAFQVAIGSNTGPAKIYGEVIAGKKNPNETNPYDCAMGGTHPTLTAAATADSIKVFDGSSWITPPRSAFTPIWPCCSGITHYPVAWTSSTSNNWKFSGGGGAISCSK